jgi:hypothetical protein
VQGYSKDGKEEVDAYVTPPTEAPDNPRAPWARYDKRID